MANQRDTARIHLGERSQKCKAGHRGGQLGVFQQPELKCVTRLLAVSGELAIHQGGAVSLVCGESDALPEQVEEHVSMAGKNLSEDACLLLLRSEPLKLFPRAAAAVIKQDSRERSSTRGSPQQRVEREGATAYGYAPSLSLQLALGRRSEQQP